MPLGHVLAASGRMWTMLIVNVVFSATLVGGSWLLMKQEAIGLASARLGSNVLLLAISLGIIRKLLWGKAPVNIGKADILSPVVIEEFERG